MIVALSQLAQRDSRYKELFNDLIDLLKEMNENLKEQNQTVVSGGSGEGSNSPQPQTQPQPRVNLSGVESQLRTISTKLDGIRSKIPSSPTGGGSIGE